MTRSSRRGFLQTSMVGAAATWAAGNLTVIAQAQHASNQVAYRNYARCLPDHLRKLALDAATRRDEALARLTTPKAVQERQRWARQTFWQLVGGEPAKTPLNLRTLRTQDFANYRIDFIAFESQPGVHVTGNLYIPKQGNGPFPGVLFQCGHAANGKAYPLYQICCQSLAQLGFVVLSFDPMGQGERTNYPGEKPWLTRLPGSADDEHTLPGKQMILAGDSPVRYQTWDAVRALDVLASHPQVDPKRLASTGQSGGGTNTMLLAAVDDRLAAAVPCCANAENLANKYLIPPGSTDDAEQNILGSGPVGFDRWDLLYPMAPKPLLMLVSGHDFAGTYSANYIRNGREEFAKLQRVYALMGQANKIDWQESLLPHSVSYGLRMQTYNWLRRWLQGESKPLVDEPPTAPLTEEEILVTREGNVNLAFQGVSPAALARRSLKQTKADPTEVLQQSLGVRGPASRATFKPLAETQYPGIRLEALEVQSAENVYLPAWLYRSSKGTAKTPARIALVLNPAGKQGWREGEFAANLSAKGHAVCLADIRGVGNLQPELTPGARGHAQGHSTEQHYAWSSLILGESLLAQRVKDILALTDALLRHTGASSLSIAASGFLTTAAISAALFDTRIQHLTLSGGLTSFRDLLDAEEFAAGGYFVPRDQMGQDVFGSFVPGILTRTDIPQMLAALAPRSVIVAGAVGASGAVVPVDKAQSLYGAMPHIRLQPRAIGLSMWNEENLGLVL